MLEFHLPRELKKRKIKLRQKDYNPPLAGSHRRIRQWAPEIEPQEILLDSLAQKREEELGISEKKFETPLSKNILRGFLISVLIFNLLLFARTFQFQVIEGKDFSALSERNKFTIYQIKAERGVIYDRVGNQLIWNRPSFDLVLNKKALPQADSERTKILKEISAIINKNFDGLEKEIEESVDSEILISENLPHQTLILLEARIGDLPGFEVRNNTIRDYKEGFNFAHLVGYTGKINAEELKAAPDFYTIFDWVGRQGLEKSYEEVLRKNPGKLRIEKDALGNIISQETISLPESGKSLVLWLDADLQRKIKEELEKKYKETGAKGAVAIAMNPKTGGILSLVSLPSFDNNLFQKGADPKTLKELLEDPKESLLNRVISGRYLTGSTIKPLIASAALEEKIISPQKALNCQGKIVIPNPWDPASPTIKKDWTTHGFTDLRKAIAESCNVYFYTLGGGFGNQEGLGVIRIKKYLELFGWGQITGIDLPGEATGFVPDKEWKKKTLKEAWVDGDTYNLAIGQGFIKITPLEVVTAFAAIANGGKLLQPQAVQKIVDKEKNVVEELKPEIIRENFIDPKNLQIVREGMRQAVTGENSPLASAVTLNSLPVSAATKTGTAELGKDRYNKWVTVFAPYEDPEIVLTVMIENVKGAQTVVLPVAKAILEWYFNPLENPNP